VTIKRSQPKRLFAAGEAYQFDWSEEEVEIGGQRVKAAHCRLTHSRQPFVMVFPSETHEMVFVAHVEAATPIAMSQCDSLPTVFSCMPRVRLSPTIPACLVEIRPNMTPTLPRPV
jgi:hypothetical protein